MKQTFDLFPVATILPLMHPEVASGNETRERLLDAAEELFAEKGFEAVSLREITNAADANVAAVNYHFGSKEKMINSVMARHVVPINEERMVRLDQLLAREEKPTVQEVLDAFLLPMVERVQGRKTRQRLFSKFMGRMMGESTKGIPDELLPQFQMVAKKVVAAFQVAVPKLTEEEAYCRLKFSFAVMADAMLRDEAFEQLSEGKLSHWGCDRLFEEAMKFNTGGMKS